MRKAQAAMEFLLSYGWAILIVIIAISSLAYFGVLNFDYFKPSMCVLPNGLSCLDYTYEDGKFTFSFKNNKGSQIIVDQISADGCAPISPGCIMENEETVTLTLTCGKFEGGITIRYTDSNTGLAHNDQSTSSIKGTDSDGEESNDPQYQIYYDMYYDECTKANMLGTCQSIDHSLGEDGVRQICCDYFSICCHYCSNTEG